MDSNTLRKKFIQFFVERDHKHLPTASLIPEDQSVLFTTAGMQPLVPYLMGEKHPVGDKLVNIQRCIRTDDIEEVGDESHLTFFEMMGYWSLGSYWKKEAIKYTFDFFTKELRFDSKKLGVTCFEGDPKNNIPKDNESAEIWKSLGINRITFLGYKDNFWGPTGIEGPCGPDTEIFIWSSEDEIPAEIDVNDKKWVEIGNDVFMQYNKKSINEGFIYEELSQKNVDFGAGFERISAFVEDKNNVYETDLFASLIQKIEEISGKKYSDHVKEFRIIVDHTKSAVFAINDGILPSNKECGYIVRRLIRRAIIKGNQIGIIENFIGKIAQEVFKTYEGIYQFDQKMIQNELEKEETKFRNTLLNGLKEFEKEKQNLSGEIAFNLYQTYGFPWEMTVELAEENKIDINREGFEKAFEKHQELSRTASAGMFKGGLAGGGEVETKYHTATHLLLASLRQVLGQDVYQKGSNITAERLRFDFNYEEKLTDEQIKKVEDLVNEQIKKDLPVKMQEMTLEEAKKSEAMGVFENKYGDKVKVYSIGNSSTSSEPPFSREICGGPHVKSTGELGHFKITKEESSSAGVRRIKAILE